MYVYYQLCERDVDTDPVFACICIKTLEVCAHTQTKKVVICLGGQSDGGQRYKILSMDSGEYSKTKQSKTTTHSKKKMTHRRVITLNNVNSRHEQMADRKQ